VFIPSGIIFFAGIFLLLKKEISWIQPPTERGSIVNEMPQISYEQMLSASRSKPQAGIAVWTDIKKIDYRPDFFADWVKLYVFLPVGLILIIMWGTGIYLFLLPQMAKARKRARKRKNATH